MNNISFNPLFTSNFSIICYLSYKECLLLTHICLHKYANLSDYENPKSFNEAGKYVIPIYNLICLLSDVSNFLFGFYFR